MADEMEIELALAHLEAGKFSFRMVDAIKNHVDKLENELAATRSQHASAVDDARRFELANWRLEAELTKLNAKIHALLKANALTELAVRTMAALAAKTAEFLEVLKKDGLPKAKALAETAIREVTPVVVKASKTAVRELTPIVQKAAKMAAREMEPVAAKAGEYLQIAKKQAGVSFEKASAYLSNLHKSAI
jgi:hypothetical protein